MLASGSSAWDSIMESTASHLIGKSLRTLCTFKTSFGTAAVAEGVPPQEYETWVAGFENYALDHRYYEIIHESLRDQFAHYYLFLRDANGMTRAIQPFFIVSQDLAAGIPEFIRNALAQVRRLATTRANYSVFVRNNPQWCAPCHVHRPDYTVALKYHLYFVTWRDNIGWALKNGFHTYHSGPLNYDPKYHLRMDLEPLDLYVRSAYDWLNLVFKPILPLLEPTRYDRVIRKFTNANELWRECESK